jgi:hypothetical protein
MATQNKIINPAVPNLPLGTQEYERRYQDQFTNVLRLYFNQLRNALGELFGTNGGRYLEFPHIAASDGANQYATAANTPTIIRWSTLDSGSGFTLNSDNTATAAFPGIYKITYSLQFANDDNAIHDAIVWLRVNGSSPSSINDVPNSTTIFTLQARKSALLPNYVCGYSEVVFAMNAGDSVGLWWGTDQAATSGGATGIYIAYQAAQTSPMPYPAVPSVIGSITFVSALPT